MGVQQYVFKLGAGVCDEYDILIQFLWICNTLELNNEERCMHISLCHVRLDIGYWDSNLKEKWILNRVIGAW